MTSNDETANTRSAARAPSLERLSRIVVFASVAVALGLQTYLGAREWDGLPLLAVAAFVIAFVMARWSADRVWWPVLGVAYVFPVMFQAALGRFLLTDQVVWLGALFAIVLARTEWRRWSFPDRWKLPLVYWALAIALVWPMVVARETDFRWSMLLNYYVGSSGLGAPPPFVALMVLNVSLTYLVGLLCFDAFFAIFGTLGGERFRKAVVVPLAVSLLLAAGIALYQGLVDISWLSDHQWPVLQRAAGGLLDGDAFGALAGFWSCLFLAVPGTGTGGWMLGMAGAAIAWGGLWASASRMALLSGVVTLIFAVWYGLRTAAVRRSLLLLLAIGAAAALLTVAGPLQWSTASPVQRTLDSLPALSRESLAKFAKDELFDRYAPFGTASVRMVEQFPVTGVGVGNFYSLFPDYAYLIAGTRAWFDNAQSWYRHQLAELGAVGSLGWIWWVGSFGWLLFTTGGGESRRFPAGIVKGALVAVAIVSAVSMPTQVIPVSFTVWVFAFWYLSLSTEAQQRLEASRRTAGWKSWLVIWLVAVGFVADTYWVGRTELRPPFRAITADWDYERGMYDLERPAAGEPFRWTAANAVSVFPEKGLYLKLTFWAHHPDLAEKPVEVRMARRDQEIARVSLSAPEPVTWYVRALPEAPRMMLETWVSRTWRPSDYGSSDNRELGIALADWTFVDEPPAGAAVIE